ncbi:MAG: DUF5618 family protein [Paludibacteraceae bacterium]|nr:DUF5618 family protein [Paludibacteraceae bacterium]
MERKDPIEEARRYVANAKDLLVNHGDLDIETQTYTDRKYVRMAGNTLWNGVLYILNKAFKIKKQKGGRLSIDDYRAIVGQRDRKLLSWVNQGYDILHLSMGYDSIQNKDICNSGFRVANEIIDWCEKTMKQSA